MDNQVSIDLNFGKIPQVVSEIQSFENGIFICESRKPFVCVMLEGP